MLKLDFKAKYLKYKKKYIVYKKEILKQIGSGIEEYDDESRPVLQTIFTNIDNIANYYFFGDRVKNSVLNDILKRELGESMLIEVRGNGLCMLNAVCTVNYLCIHNLSNSDLLSALAGYHNIDDATKKIKYGNSLNVDITGYIKSTYGMVQENLIPISDQIIRQKTEEMGFPVDYEILDFKKDMDQENYSFVQLGQVLSTVLQIVIILLNIDIHRGVCSIYGKFPNDEKSMFAQEEITQNILSNKWKVIFILNIGDRHYNSLIPRGRNELIRDNNIERYQSIKDKIQWT